MGCIRIPVTFRAVRVAAHIPGLWGNLLPQHPSLSSSSSEDWQRAIGRQGSGAGKTLSNQFCWKEGGGSREVLEGGGGCWDPKVCIPKKAQQASLLPISFFSTVVTLVWGGGRVPTGWLITVQYYRYAAHATCVSYLMIEGIGGGGGSWNGDKCVCRGRGQHLCGWGRNACLSADDCGCWGAIHCIMR